MDHVKNNHKGEYRIATTNSIKSYFKDIEKVLLRQNGLTSYPSVHLTFDGQDFFSKTYHYKNQWYSWVCFLGKVSN